MTEESNLRASSSTTPTTSCRTGGMRTRGGRLPPVMGREISLSGTKRIFTPTIPQRRAKPKGDTNRSEERTDKSDSKSRSRDGRRERGRGRGRREFIQVTGALFGEGLAQGSAKKPSRDSDYTKNVVVEKPVFKPTIVKTKKEMENESLKIENEDECDFSEGLDDDDDLPVVLPLEVPVKSEVKSELDMKVETKEQKFPVSKTKDKAEDTPFKEDGCSPGKEEKQLKLEEADTKDIIYKTLKIDEESEEFIIFQFPTSLFEGITLSDDVSEGVPEEGPSKEMPNENKQKEAISSNGLRDVKDGFVGKLRFTKSGAMRLVTGSTVMKIEQSNFFNFGQELVHIQNHEGSQAEITALGMVNKYLNVYPDAEKEIENAL